MGSTTENTRKKVTIQTIQNLYKKNEPITVLTASDFPSGHVADTAGMEIVLVGDSLAMVAMGMEDTNEVTMDEMLLHCRSVKRAVKSAFTVSWILNRPILEF
jgi:3-methyl-2-oxobutanoate hydroxymethyltransferase